MKIDTDSIIQRFGEYTSTMIATGIFIGFSLGIFLVLFLPYKYPEIPDFSLATAAILISAITVLSAVISVFFGFIIGLVIKFLIAIALFAGLAYIILQYWQSQQ